MWQFCFALSLYTESMLEGEHPDSVKEFQNWMLIEILSCLSTVVTSILYLALRQLAPKERLMLGSDKDDETQDFMGNQINLMVLVILQMALCPAVTNIIMVYILPKTSLLIVTDDRSMEMLKQQF